MDYDVKELEEYQYDDHTTFGHHLLRQVREVRGYLRRVQQELPTLQKYATPYRPPTEQQILRFQTITHLGEEEHPLDAKVVLTVQLNALCRVAKLSDTERHKLLLLCGPRYDQASGELRFSCERFPSRVQNKRYLSDLLDKVIAEAKNGEDTFADIPLTAVTNPRKVPVEKPKFPVEWLRPSTEAAAEEVEQIKAQSTMRHMKEATRAEPALPSTTASTA
ncbi:mitochondrial ribosomal subunit protein-domain-containing protein [Thamnocephalis sphaerospora]|uniref:Mitochondrial ribosomal subunit protein-domain-containing protein n=1 Tax=Thamnocephalis sphaerospora TaxID=78915 RepID=A0A4P9XML6_9FUNG|nr:mitochondrial ribosomal subunit protein-domain-containing protein [Thamnocephalis sphaerospora]|eukprot:RKP07042.1 mitochondrial ribosomal subunit protein-domain-containing protein [Thamnocephalis sphaerospora]